MNKRPDHAGLLPMTTTILDGIDAPDKLREMSIPELNQVAQELRQFILESVATTGGHLASNLGVVELTVALHHVFRTPKDQLVWDVGHQSYAHKVLTGRKEAMAWLRSMGGMAGFTSRDESPYDPFGAGHAGTAISAAVGIAMGLRKTASRVVAVVGDGALSAGMSFEGLNHAGSFKSLPLTIILNDNGMSISPALGGLHDYLQDVVKEWKYSVAIAEAIGRQPNWPFPTLFDFLGVDYTGPVDGHDIEALVRVLGQARTATRPLVVHVVTTKGKGYGFAEADPVRFHGITPVALDTGRALKSKSAMTFSNVFSRWICTAGAHDRRIHAITPAMREGSDLVEFENRYPDRYIDAAIAEQHAVTLAAGLAVTGAKPVVAIYSTFLQRGYDQVIHDVALQNLPVLFAVDRAGIAGNDGATHLGAFDIAALRCIPNLTIMTPSDGPECYRMLAAGIALGRPAVVRYPRASAEIDSFEQIRTPIEIGTAQVCRLSRQRSKRIALLAFGPLLSVAMQVGKVLDATVVNMRFVKPLDTETLLKVAQDHDTLVTLEEGVVQGGAGSACAEYLAAFGLGIRMLLLGLPDAFVAHGGRDEVLAALGLDLHGVTHSIRRFVDKQLPALVPSSQLAN